MAQDNKNKILNVPPLRFPEFIEDWELQSLSEYLTFKNGLNPDAKRFGRGVKFISVMDILKNDFITYDAIISLVEPQKDDFEGFGVEYGDVLFQRSSETFEDIGRANVYLDDRKALFGGFVIRGKQIKRYNPRFIKYLLSAPCSRKKIIVKGAGAQHFNIGQEGLSKVVLNFPSLDEQEKIGKFLSLIDERIATQNKIIEKLQSLIKGLVDETIDSLDCEFIKFADIYMEAKEGGTPSTSVREYYERGTVPFIKIDDLTNKYLSSNKDYITELGMHKSSAWLIPAGSIIFSNGATIGAVSISTYPVTTKQGILGIVPKNNIDVEYLYYLLNSTYFTKEVERIITEGTMRTAYLKDINKIMCPIPNLPIQNQISRVLSSYSQKLRYEQDILECYDSQKHYFLSKLFI